MYRPSKYELQHAVLYATEQTRLYMMEKYRKRYPRLFSHAHLQIRPATREDYYVPDTLECIVVEKTYFTETGCLRLGCFPYKLNGLPCEKTDPVRWIPIGSNHTTLSCQANCWQSENTVDTEWINNQCMAVNPLKKLLAIFPEKAFGQTSKHPLHSGLDWKNAQMILNKDYCAAYGLEFDGNDCFAPTGQYILELLLGKTIYRAMKTADIQRPKHKLPPIPKELQRTLSDVPDVTDIAEAPMETSKIAEEIAKEVAFDFGLDITSFAVEKILRKKAPKLIMKAASNIPVKSALVQVVLRQTISMSVRSLATIGKLVGGLSNVFAIYSIFSIILDVIDPFNYDSVLTADMLKNINERLDFLYFRRENESMREMTPEVVWDTILAEEDESDRYEYMADKISEYLLAIRSRKVDYAPKLNMFNFEIQKQQRRWNLSMHVVILIMLIALTLLWIEWIHLWGVIIFFCLVYTTKIK